MASLSNQRGEYGDQQEPQPILRTSAPQPQTKITITNLVVIGVGAALGAFGWPRYAKNKPDGVLALGAAGSMISAGLLGLLLGKPGGSS